MLRNLIKRIPPFSMLIDKIFVLKRQVVELREELERTRKDAALAGTLGQSHLLPEDDTNLSYALHRELVFWDDATRENVGCNVSARLPTSSEADLEEACPEFLREQVIAYAERCDRKPRILDFASGPFTQLHYLERRGMAEVVPVDILAGEYKWLYEKYAIEGVTEPKPIAGELLNRKLSDSFDIVWIGNALDHTGAPVLTWHNLFQLTKVGGLILHWHFTREATQAAQDELHQYDLFPKGDSLWIDNLKGRTHSLTENLPLTCIAQHESPEGRAFFMQAFEKTGADAQGSVWMSHVLADLQDAYMKRHAWALKLEAVLNQGAGLGTEEVPYIISPDKI